MLVFKYALLFSSPGIAMDALIIALINVTSLGIRSLSPEVSQRRLLNGFVGLSP